MTEHYNESSQDWIAVASQACRDPGSIVECPLCHAQSVTAAWHLVDPSRRRAMVDLACSSCKATKNLQIELPDEALGFFPPERLPQTVTAMEQHAASITDRIRQHVKMPAAAFTTNPLWDKAKWSATTFRWHPASEAPPIMGIVFDDAGAGKELFREFAKDTNHADEFEELRVSIIEGAVPGQRPGYSVHLCPDPDGLAARATVDDFVVDPAVVPFLGRWNRMFPIPGSPALLPKFKREFEKHKEFLLAPAVRRQDGQLWFEPELGIVKTVIHFRNLSELTQNDPDAAALVLPQLITPPV